MKELSHKNVIRYYMAWIEYASEQQAGYINFKKLKIS